jgi:hypothetical protein
MRFSMIFALLCVAGAFGRPSAASSTAALGRDVGSKECVRGRYVEARTASVYAGACHYGSEATTSGREALLAWHFDSGAWHGVDLSGVDVVLVVAGDENLAAESGARRSIVYADARLPRERRDAAIDLVLSRCKDLSGEVRRVLCAELGVAIADETYAVVAPRAFELRGSKLANRECCKMPYNVWYAPFVALIDPIVGCDSIFRFDDKTLGPTWNRARQNESFVGRFEWTSESSSPAAGSRTASSRPISAPTTSADSRPADREADARAARDHR